MPDEPEAVYPPCRCGREYRKLNPPASTRPACVGCGFDRENCRCPFSIKVYPPKDPAEVFSKVVGHE